MKLFQGILRFFPKLACVWSICRGQLFLGRSLGLISKAQIKWRFWRTRKLKATARAASVTFSLWLSFSNNRVLNLILIYIYINNTQYMKQNTQYIKYLNFGHNFSGSTVFMYQYWNHSTDTEIKKFPNSELQETYFHAFCSLTSPLIWQMVLNNIVLIFFFGYFVMLYLCLIFL